MMARAASVLTRFRHGGAYAAIALAVLVLCGCANDPDLGLSGAPSGPVTVQPVSFPDVSRAPASVQRQLREHFDALTKEIERASDGPALAAAFGGMGMLFLAAEYADAAERCLLNARLLSPDEPRWSYYLGQLHRTAGAPAKAAPFFEEVVRLRPDDVAALVWLADAYLQEGKPDAAELLLVRALSQQPDVSAAVFGLGRVAAARRDFTRAVEHFERALAIDDRSSIIHYPLAMAYRELGRLDKVEAHLGQRGSVEIGPPDPAMQALAGILESAASYEARGVRALEQDQADVAIELFRKGLALEPDVPSLRHRLGTALYLAGDTAGARHEFERVVQLSPEFAGAHYSLGVMLASDGRYRDAIGRFSEALVLQPDYVEARVALAETLRDDGRAAEALEHYEDALRMDPRLPAARLGRAMTLVSLARYPQAHEALSEGMRLHPDRIEFPHALARLLAAAPDDDVRDGAQATAMMQKLRSEAPTFELIETAAMTLAERGRFRDAADAQRAAMAAAAEAGRGDIARRMAANLTLYESRRPCRTPWRPGELP
jgi:tetratricopeptide (TPR) repeat protein